MKNYDYKLFQKKRSLFIRIVLRVFSIKRFPMIIFCLGINERETKAFIVPTQKQRNQT
jgi:hypothetical protein